MRQVKLAIVDYGMGNLRSVVCAFQEAAPEVQIMLAQDAQTIDQADRVVLPGQGAMRDCMVNLRQSGLYESLLRAISNKPLLGVCVGQQMLFESSAEGNVPALGVFPGHVKRFDGELFASLEHQGSLKVPHMGWSRVQQTQAHPIWEGIPDTCYFYFVHSYYVEPGDARLTVGLTLYGNNFACATARENIFAVQFHPEKSATHGLRLYRNFVNWTV